MRGILLALFICATYAYADYVPNQFLIKINPNLINSFVFLNELESNNISIQRDYKIVEGLYLVQGESEGITYNYLTNHPSIEYVEKNYIRKISMVGNPEKPNNILLSEPPIPTKVDQPKTWVDDPKMYSNFGVSQNKVNDVWSEFKYYGNKKTIIAVIDTGVDYTHKDLAANMWRNPGETGIDSNGKDKSTNGIDDDGNGYADDVVGWDFANKDSLPYDDQSHGTHVAGIAAAVGGNQFGISGHCPRCSVMALKFITDQGTGTDADAILAIEYATKMGAHILNSSWGSPAESKALADTFIASDKAGAINVFAAGNDGVELGFNALRAFPAMYPTLLKLKHAVSVAALNGVSIFIPWWSNFGWWYVHFSTAGAAVYSTIPGGRYAEYYGTSMAAPGVAGDFGLLKSLRPDLTGEELIKVMKKHIFPDKDSMNMVHFGGRPNIYSAYKALK